MHIKSFMLISTLDISAPRMTTINTSNDMFTIIKPYVEFTFKCIAVSSGKLLYDNTINQPFIHELLREIPIPHSMLFIFALEICERYIPLYTKYPVIGILFGLCKMGYIGAILWDNISHIESRTVWCISVFSLVCFHYTAIQSILSLKLI